MRNSNMKKRAFRLLPPRKTRPAWGKRKRLGASSIFFLFASLGACPHSPPAPGFFFLAWAAVSYFCIFSRLQEWKGKIWPKRKSSIWRQRRRAAGDRRAAAVPWCNQGGGGFTNTHRVWLEKYAGYLKSSKKKESPCCGVSRKNLFPQQQLNFIRIIYILLHEKKYNCGNWVGIQINFKKKSR